METDHPTTMKYILSLLTLCLISAGLFAQQALFTPQELAQLDIWSGKTIAAEKLAPPVSGVQMSYDYSPEKGIRFPSKGNA